ncbi:MAG TPA: hypothetical protein VNM90_13970 [Haliangium sp.]|nr:hypothetical protein [Haliangium sp.]
MRARISMSLLMTLGSIVGAAPALAGDGTSPDRPSGPSATLAVEPAGQGETHVEHSYLADVIALDTTNLAFTVITAGFGSVLTVPSYLLGAPAIHASHGNRGQAALSLGARVGLPVLGAVAGHALYQRNQRRETCSDDDSIQCNDWNEAFDGVLAIAAGAVIGATSAVLFDWVVLDHTEKVPARRSLVIVPQVGVSERGAALGVAGRF